MYASDLDRDAALGNLVRECGECGGEREHEPWCSALHDCEQHGGEACRCCGECYAETGEMYACRAHCKHGKADRGETE